MKILECGWNLAVASNYILHWLVLHISIRNNCLYVRLIAQLEERLHANSAVNTSTQQKPTWLCSRPHCESLYASTVAKCPHACGHKACLHDLFPSKRERQRHGDHGDHPGGGGGRHLPPLCHYGALLQVRGRLDCPLTQKSLTPISVLPFFNNYLSCNIIIFFFFSFLVATSFPVILF